MRSIYNPTILIIISLVLNYATLCASKITCTSTSINSEIIPQTSNFQEKELINNNVEKAMNIVQTNIEWLEETIKEFNKAKLYYEMNNKIGGLGVELFKLDNYLYKIKKIVNIIEKNLHATSLPQEINSFNNAKQNVDELSKNLSKICNTMKKSQNTDKNIVELASELSSIYGKLDPQLNKVKKSVYNSLLNNYEKLPYEDMKTIDSLINEDRYNIVENVLNADYSNLQDIEKNMLDLYILGFSDKFVKDLNTWYEIRNSLRSNKIDRAIIYLSYLLTYFENELNEPKDNKILNKIGDNAMRENLEFIFINVETQYNDSKKSIKLLSSTYKNKEKLRKLKTVFNFVEQKSPKNNEPNIKNNELKMGLVNFRVDFLLTSLIL